MDAYCSPISGFILLPLPLIKKSKLLMFVRLSVFVSLIVFVSSCSSSKKALKGDIVEQDLDSIEIIASRDNPYRSSATRYFDLVNNKLEVKFDYEKQYLYGKATITLKPHFYSQKELVLDAKQFDIYEVSLITGDNNREGLRYTYDSLQLKIQLNKEYARDGQLKIYIDYTAKPNERKIGGSAAINEDKGLYFINPLGKDTAKPVQIWTQGETESNSCWFPTIDKPNQRCTDDIYITHHKKYVSLSNGTLVLSVSVNDSMVTDYWKMDLPHAPYLVMMAIGDFAVIHDRWRDVPVDYYVEPKNAMYANLIFGNTPEMMEFFSQKLNFDYPWPKYSQVIVKDYVSGAMENTSATLHGDFMQRDSRELLDETNEEVVSHELFHQWFGDLVSPESWSNLPLNESFATYGEYLWHEYKYGREFADYKQRMDFNKYLEEAKEKNVDLIRFRYDDREDMFDRHSYEKGGLVLHYLRKTIGDEAFFKALETYLKANQFKAAEVHNLRMAFEEVTGTDLNWFFNQWFLNAGHPVLDVHYGYTADSIFVSIEQKHNIDRGLVYQLPFKIGVWYGSNVSTYDVTLIKKSQTFSFKANGTPDLIDFDVERNVLCEKKEDKIADNYIFQYKNAPLYLQRLEALKALSSMQKQNTAAAALFAGALHDKFFAIREYAIEKIALPKEGGDSSILTVIAQLAKTDAKSGVRNAAIEKLSESTSAGKYADLFEAAVGDSSYEVASTALEVLQEVDKDKAMRIAKQFEHEKNGYLAGAVANVYAKEGDAAYQAYFEDKLETSTGFAKYTIFYHYANFLTRMNKDVVLQGIKTIEEEGIDTENHFFTAASKGSLKRIQKSFDEKKKETQSELSAEKSKEKKLKLQEEINNYDLILTAACESLSKVNAKKVESEQ